MEYNNKILFTALLILVLGVVAFNFNGISGAPIRESGVTIDVLTEEVNCDISGGYGQGIANVDFMINAPSGVNLDSVVTVKDSRGNRKLTDDVSSSSRIPSGVYGIDIPCDPEEFTGPLSICARDPKSGAIICSTNAVNIRYT